MYNGWKNYETWNVALWIGNDEGLYNMALEYTEQHKDDGCGVYKGFVEGLREVGSLQTPDSVAWNDSGLDYPKLDEMMTEL